MKGACSRCRVRPRRTTHRYCNPCHAEFMRRWRKQNPMPASQRAKDRARHIAGVYKRRGKLVPQPCEVCASPRVEMHHDDYSKPLQVRWLCREHHLAHHREQQSLAA